MAFMAICDCTLEKPVVQSKSIMPVEPAPVGIPDIQGIRMGSFNQ